MEINEYIKFNRNKESIEIIRAGGENGYFTPPASFDIEKIEPLLFALGVIVGIVMSLLFGFILVKVVVEIAKLANGKGDKSALRIVFFVLLLAMCGIPLFFLVHDLLFNNLLGG